MSEARAAALLAALPGCDLPAELRAWLLHGFEAQAAGGCLLEALNLPGADLDRRDALLQSVVAATPGDSLQARILTTIDCVQGNREHPRRDMQLIVKRLRQSGCDLSARQLRRIVAGRRQDGWRGCDIDAVLCHWPRVAQDAINDPELDEEIGNATYHPR